MQEVSSLKPVEAAPSGCKDLPWAILFIINVGAIIVCMGIWGIKTFSEQSSSSGSSVFSQNDVTAATGVLLGIGVVAVVLSLAMVKLIVTYAECMIRFTLWFNVGIAFAMAIFGFLYGNFFLGIFGVLIALITLCYARAMMHRIPFAVANLRVAAAAISKHGSTYCVAFGIVIFEIGWVVAWSLAFLGVMDQMNVTSSTTTSNTGKAAGEYCTSSSQCASRSCNTATKECRAEATIQISGTTYAVFFFMLLSFYWGMQVFKNISHTTIAGTVATWWYNAESKGATGASLKRSCTTSLGSICLGSLLVAIIQVLRSMAEQARQEGSGAACLAECILGCIQSIMEYFNRWAYVYIGVYGYKFSQAGKAVFELFHQRGFDAIINDDLIGNVLGFAALAVGLICAGLGVLAVNVFEIVKFSNADVYLAIMGFVVGVSIAVTPLSVIDSSVATIFVCFAEDPAAFQQSHPDLYQPLVAEWHALYPEIMVACGYWRT